MNRKFRFLVYFVLITAFFSCSFGREEYTYYESENLGYDLVDSVLVILEKYPSTKTPLPNRHQPEIIDTLLSFNNSSIQAEVYQSKKGKYLRKLFISQGEIKITSWLYIGADKTSILKELGLYKSNDRLHIGPLEEIDVFEIFFKKGKVSEIVFWGFEG